MGSSERSYLLAYIDYSRFLARPPLRLRSARNDK